MENPRVTQLIQEDVAMTGGVGVRAELESSDENRHSANHRPVMQTDNVYITNTQTNERRQTNGYIRSNVHDTNLRSYRNHNHEQREHSNSYQRNPEFQERRRSIHTLDTGVRRNSIDSRRVVVENDRVSTNRQNSNSSNTETNHRSIRAQQPHRLDYAYRRNTDPRSRRFSDPRIQTGHRAINSQPRARAAHDYHDIHWRQDGDDFRGVSSATTHTSRDRTDDHYEVPTMPMPVAVVCCLLNFLIPGTGSMCASVCVFCCARTDGMTCREKLGSCCTVFGIGVLQLLLVACFLIGWIWSCIWGVTFIGMSAYYHDDEYSENDEYSSRDRRAEQRHTAVTNDTRQPGGTPLPAPQVVVDQPFPGVRYDDMRTNRESRRRRSSRPRRSPRFPLTSSNLIYPMRAPSNIAYSSPPPPYREAETPHPAGHHRNGEPPPAYTSRQSRTRRQHRHMENGETINEENYR